MRISDWSSDVCSSDLDAPDEVERGLAEARIAVAGEERLALGPARKVDVHARAVVASNRLRHEGRGLSVGVGDHEIGRAPCSETVCPYVSLSVVAVSLTNTKTTPTQSAHTTKPP